MRRGRRNSGPAECRVFVVVGVDLKAQPRYPGDGFVRGDALMDHVDFSAFDLIWASPPCQAHTALRKMWNAKPHADLIPQTRALLRKSGRPYGDRAVEGALDAAERVVRLGVGTVDRERDAPRAGFVQPRQRVAGQAARSARRKRPIRKPRCVP